MAAIECKLAMCISRLVKFELLLDLKIEQKMELHCIPRINSSPAIMPLAHCILGYIFFGGICPSKIGHIAPFLATIQRLSKARVFLYT
jgi:hypothetical protein